MLYPLLISLVKSERNQKEEVIPWIYLKLLRGMWGVSSLRILTLDDLDNRRITNLFENYHPIERLHYAD